VLSGARLRDDSLFSHAAREEHLSHGVVDLVRAGVIEVLSLEPDWRSDVFRKSRRVAQCRWATDVRREHLLQLGDESRVDARGVIRLLEIVDGRYERFRNIPSAEHTESVVLLGCHVGMEACATASRKARIRS
jgi:hypothetical protein